ncbi:MAG: prolipoprotein diacylglyceryl transferase [Oscillospiraceae bacterium]|nr:prolipoprotein diacylglyceryl transferase [Oscillospiraceae bacterium]
MLPYIDVLGRQISMYGVMIAAGAVAALVWALWYSRGDRVRSADLELALIYGVIGVAVGAKLLYVVTVLPEFLRDLPYLFTYPAAFFRTYLAGGFVFYGGLYGFLAAVALYVHFAKADGDHVWRGAVPAVALFHGFGRVGCFLAGCCYGVPSHGWGVVFHQSEIAPTDTALVPIQLYGAVGEFLLFGVLVYLAYRKITGRRILGVYLCAYSAGRFALEFWRGDVYRGIYGGLSLSQWISLVTAALGLWLLLSRRRQKQ